MVTKLHNINNKNRTELESYIRELEGAVAFEGDSISQDESAERIDSIISMAADIYIRIGDISVSKAVTHAIDFFSNVEREVETQLEDLEKNYEIGLDGPAEVA